MLPSVLNNNVFIGKVGGWRVGGWCGVCVCVCVCVMKGREGSSCEWGPLSSTAQETADARLSAYKLSATVSAPAARPHSPSDQETPLECR